MTRLLVLCLALSACGGGGGGDDDDVPADSNDTPATVMTVTCDGTEAAEIESTGGFRFSPNAVTIQKDQVVKFISGSNHNVIPGSAPTDPGLKIPAFGATGCLKFTATGQFNFVCQPHSSSMKGTVTVN
jgi:plastocyanin